MSRVPPAVGFFIAPALLALTALVATAGAGGATPAVPYSDPSVIGYVGLCDQAGNQITTGNVNAAPFAWRAVSSQPAPAPYSATGGTATMYVYQPLQVLAPGEWSGSQLTGSSRYSNPANPMVQSTSEDISLEDVLENFHPKWDGFMQLRIYLGAPNHQAYEIHYPALNLEITGDTWTAVGGGPVDCKAGTAVSDESVLLPSLQSTTVPSTAAASGHSTSGTSARSATTPTAAPGVSSEEKGAASQSSQGQETVGAKAGGSKASSSDVSLLGGIAVGALVVLGLIFLFLRKRRTDGVRA